MSVVDNTFASPLNQQPPCARRRIRDAERDEIPERPLGRHRRRGLRPPGAAGRSSTDGASLLGVLDPQAASALGRGLKTLPASDPAAQPHRRRRLPASWRRPGGSPGCSIPGWRRTRSTRSPGPRCRASAVWWGSRCRAGSMAHRASSITAESSAARRASAASNSLDQSSRR